MWGLCQELTQYHGTRTEITDEQDTNGNKIQTTTRYRRQQDTDDNKIQTTTRYRRQQDTDDNKIQTTTTHRRQQHTDDNKIQTTTRYRRQQDTDDNANEIDAISDPLRQEVEVTSQLAHRHVETVPTGLDLIEPGLYIFEQESMIIDCCHGRGAIEEI
jgi:hypothetical protein